MINVKLYKYDSSQESNGYRGQDFSSYVLQGFEDNEDITQELDTSEIGLYGLNFEKEFDPETKFIIDISQEIEGNISTTTLHRVVARDIVGKKILSDDTYFDHHISFIEPSVIAQKRLVDNISVTYKLKDVSLQQKSAFPDTSIKYGFVSSEFIPEDPFYIDTNVSFPRSNYRIDFGKYFKLENDLQISNVHGNVTRVYNDIENFKNLDNTYTCDITIPRLEIYTGVRNSSSFQMIGHASLHYKLSEYSLTDPNTPTIIAEGDIISNDNLGGGLSLDAEAWQSTINGEWLYESAKIVDTDYYGYNGHPNYYYKKYTNRTASTPNYTLSNITVQTDKQYVLEVSLYNFPDNIPSFQYGARAEKYNKSIPTYYSSTAGSYNNSTPLKQSFTRFITYEMTTENIQASTEMVTYTEEEKSILFASSTPYSALNLLQKAIVNSSIYEKKEDIYVGDVNANDLPFVIDQNYVDKLASTRVIENFYNQKNLWEIMIEVGHYIHAIPEIVFGADDKLKITFNELGRTDEKENKGTTSSVFNSRSVEDYISATSSYVSNMVQLGGFIEEWVAPKTSDETLLISNDTATIKTTKPIIELLSLQVKSNINQNIGGIPITAGQVVDLTQYIYEKNVYDILPIIYYLYPNRGMAMYYELGTNEIKGGNYRLPQANYNIYNDYSFKKIIWCAYAQNYPVLENPIPSTNYWTDLKVNNFTFFVRYRTKDTVRQNQSRPDIRKYLLNSKYDRYPEHNQFNNQQDILVDSAKFGNNVYGKLIKTGNSEYTISEWNDTTATLKHKGELYRINGDLYYVANVKHLYFPDYIISEVKYSKDYNELSSVIGIPSEPRFYEISEQSAINREVAINDLFVVTDDWTRDLDIKTGFVFKVNHIKDLVFGTGTGTFAKYALTVFKGDKDITNYGLSIGQPNFYKEILSPLNAYSSENTLTYEWDMVDNYSAGDQVLNTNETAYAIEAREEGNDIVPKCIDAGNYNSLQAFGYTDIYGKSALMDFYVLGGDINLSPEEIRKFPESPITTKYKYVGEMQVTQLPTTSELDDFDYQETGLTVPTQGHLIKVVLTENDVVTYYIYTYVYDEDNGFYWQQETIDSEWTPIEKQFLGDKDLAKQIYATNVFDYDKNYNGRGIALLKDNRESLSMNYNLQMITSSDTFVLSPFIFLPNKQNVSIVLLKNEVNKISNGYININDIITAKDSNGNDILDSNGDPYFHWTSSQLALLSNLSYTNGWNLTDWNVGGAFSLRLDQILTNVNAHHFDGTEGYDQVKSIAIICDVNQSSIQDISTGGDVFFETRQLVMAKNIPEGTTKTDAIKFWSFGSPNKNGLFRNKQ